MNTNSDMVELRAESVRFYSQVDEARFFGWLDKVPSVERYEGRGLTLYIYVNPAAMDEDDLRELLALFHRYAVDMRQLAVFDRADFAEWFRDKAAYWHNDVFGGGRQG